MAADVLRVAVIHVQLSVSFAACSCLVTVLYGTLCKVPSDMFLTGPMQGVRLKVWLQRCD